MRCRDTCRHCLTNSSATRLPTVFAQFPEESPRLAHFPPAPGTLRCNPDPPRRPAIVPPGRAFNASRHAYLSRQLHFGPLRIRVAIILSPVERSAAYLLALAPGFPGPGGCPGTAHHKIRLASFIYPYSVCIVSPGGAFLALRVAPLFHELHPLLASAGQTFRRPLSDAHVIVPPPPRRGHRRRRRRRAPSKLTAASLVHPDSFFVVAPRLVLFARRLATLPHQPRAMPRVRRAVVLLSVIRRTRNDLALALLRCLSGNVPRPRGEGRHQNKNTRQIRM